MLSTRSITKYLDGLIELRCPQSWHFSFLKDTYCNKEFLSENIPLIRCVKHVLCDLDDIVVWDNETRITNGHHLFCHIRDALDQYKNGPVGDTLRHRFGAMNRAIDLYTRMLGSKHNSIYYTSKAIDDFEKLSTLDTLEALYNFPTFDSVEAEFFWVMQGGMTILIYILQLLLHNILVAKEFHVTTGQMIWTLPINKLAEHQDVYINKYGLKKLNFVVPD